MATATLSKQEWPFAPQAVNNCLLWLDAADESSYTPGASISTWRNKGYSGGDATTTSGTIGSTTADINGLSAMSFATNAYMTCPSMTFTQPTRTVFVVVTIGAPGSIRQFMVSANTIDMQFYSYNTNLEMNYAGHQNYITTSPYPMFNTTSILCGTTLSTNGGIFINGLAQTPYSIDNPEAYSTGTTTTQLIGNSTDNASFVLGEAMLFDGAITDIQRQQVEGYLAAKWGLQSLLPVTHPYYTLYNLTTTAFEPTQIPTCALWLDASDATSIVGTTVARWLDKSGNGNNGIPISSGPTLVQNVQNGLPGLTFPTTASIMLCGNLLAGTNFSMLAVVKYASSGSQYASGEWKVQYGSGLLFTQGNSVVTTVGTTSTYNPFGQLAAADTSAFHIYAASLSSSTSSSSVTLIAGTDGNDTTYTNSNGPNSAATAQPFAVGGAYESSTGFYPLTGFICEVIVYNTTLTANQLKQVESYLGAKWNIPVAGQGSVAPVVNPLAIAGCQLWLDAADATTIVPVVSTWRDNSGLGNNMSLTAGAVTYVSNPGPPCVNFASGGILQTTNYISIASGVSFIFIVCQATAMSGGGFDYVIGCTDINGGDTSIRFYPNILSIGNADSNDLGNGTGGYYVNGVLSNTNPVAVPTGYNMIGVLVNRSGTTRFSLSSSFFSRFFIGNIREVIIYTGPITTTQRLQVQNYLMAKWGTGRNFWIDASDATTVTRGTTVTKWLDKSGNGNTATTLGSTVTSSAAGLAFNGSAYMSVPGIAGTLVNTPFVIFIVETLGASGTRFYFGDDNVNNSGAFGYSLHTGYRTSTNQTFAMYGSDLEDTTVSGTGNKRIWALYLPTASNRNTRRNGTVDVTFSNFNRLLAFTAPVIGRCFGGNYYVGTISEIIVYNQDIGLTAIQQIETYLGNKWDIAVATSVPGITNPSLIAGCKLWLDSADPAALVTAVSQMNDKSGNGYNITQSTAGYQPTLTNNYLSLGTSLNYYMNMPQAAINNTTPWTLFLVFNPVSSTNWIMAKQFDGTNSFNMLSMTNYTSTGGGNTTGTTGVLYFRPFNAGTLFTGPAALTTSSNQLLTMIYNGTNIYYYVNGVLAAITNGTFTIQNQTGATNATLGAWVVSGSLTNSGVTNFQLGEMSFYNSALTTTQTQQIGVSLMNKWSITNSVQTATGSLIDTPFLPTDIAGCALWLDGADTSSMTMTGTTVSQWNDKSGNSRNATILSGYTGATYSLTYNGLYFPNSTTAYATSYSGNPTTETMFVVFNNPSPSANNNMVIGGPRGARSLAGGYSGTTGVGACSYLNNEVTWSGIASMPANTYTSGSTVLITGTVNGSSSSISQNGGTTYTASGTTFNSYIVNTYIGTDSFYSPPLYYYIGYIMEIVFYNSVLSTAQIAQVNKYLKNKWNIGQTDITIPTPVYNRTFQPVDISGCVLWLDAADLSSIALSGSSVTQWNDKSGFGNNATPGVSPTYAPNSQNKLGTISFNGSSTYFDCPLRIDFSTHCLFAVHNPVTVDPNYPPYGGPGGNTGIFRFQNTIGYIVYPYTYAGAFGYVNNQGGPIFGELPDGSSAGTFQIITANILSGNSATYKDGTLVAQTGNAISGGQSDTLSIGAYGVAPYQQQYYWGSMAELIIFSSQLTESEREQIEAYLAWKWGLRASLPTSHPGYTLPSFSTVFTPKSLPNMVLWLDAADSSTITLSGSSVTQWSDKSGSGYVATPFDSAITKTTLNGTPALDFGDNRMTIPNFTWNMSFTSIIVWNAYFAGQMIGLGASTDPGATWLDYISTGNWALIMLNYNATNSTDPNYVRVPPDPYAGSPAPVVTANEWFIFSIGYTAGTTTITNYSVNGSARTANAVTAQTGTNTGAYFINGLPSGIYDNSQVAEIIHYNTSLTAHERQEVEGYLAWKWGLASLLPSDHAFKKFSP